MSSKQPQAHPQNGTQPTTAGPHVGKAAARPPSQPAWQAILWKHNDKFIKKILVGKLNGTDVTRLGYLGLPRSVGAATLKNLAKICNEGPALPKESPARHLTFEWTEYVVTKIDPPQPLRQRGLKLAFVGSLPSRIPGLGHKIIYAFLTAEDYLFLGFAPTTKEAMATSGVVDADPDETPRRLKMLISKLRRDGLIRK